MRTGLAVLVAFIALPGCQSAAMRVTPSLAAFPAMAVEGANPRRWNSPIAFGPWRTSTAREGLKWDFGLALLGITAGYSTQPYRLVIAGTGPEMQVECIGRAASLSRDGLEVDPTFGRLPAFGCGLRGAGEGTLGLHATALNAEVGTIEFEDASWNVQAIDRFEGSSVASGVPLGYEIEREGHVVAGVETINRGRVWIDTSLSARDQARLAAAITALLLYAPAARD